MSPATRFRPGVIGVGAMGGAMAARLLDRGYPVAVRDVDARRQRALVEQGARACASPASLAAECDVVVVVVVDAAQIGQVLRGPDGLLAAIGAHHAVVFCSTISPRDMIESCTDVMATGAGAVDAPISGGPQRARDGSLSMMLAADARLLQRLGPLLDDMATRCFTISDRHGDASKAKLINNLVAGINLAAATEGLALAHELGMDEQQALALISASSGQSWIGDDRLRRALQDDFEPRAQTHVLTKDLTLATTLARENGFPVPLGEQALALFKAACEAGHRDEDDAALLKYRRRWR